MLVNEDDFQAMMMKDHIYPHHKHSHPQINRFAKVTHIGGSQTASEIDLVIVEGRERAFAYEFKFLRGKDASYNYRRIYQGLGQALLYFWYGFDQSTLCIGVSENLDMLSYEKIEAKIKQAFPAIDGIQKSMPYFGYTSYFAGKTIAEALSNRYGIVNLTLHYGRKKAKAMKLAFERARIRRRGFRIKRR